MILQKIRLFPFGGIDDQEVEFDPGLNVILGPNEAGKSTLVNAIFAVIFLPSGLKKNSQDWKYYLARFLPYPRGDTIQVSFSFRSPGGEEYTLLRSWGEERKDRLFLPEGGEVNNPETIQDILRSALKYGRGTFEGVFLARQEEMIRTVEMLGENREAASNIGDILRAAVFQSGGVSLDRLKAEILEEKKSLLDLWDQERDGPKGGRGIDNPYKKGLGQVISAYYEVEELKKQIKKVAELEKKAQEITFRLREKAREKEELEKTLGVMEKLEKDIRRRANLEPTLELLLNREKSLKLINERWPGVEAELKTLEYQLLEQNERRGALEREYKEAQEVIACRKLRQLYNQARPLMEEIAEKEKELHQLPAISDEDVKGLEIASGKISRLEATLKAMKLKGQLKVIQPGEISITSGFEPPRMLRVEKEVEFEAEGRVLLESKDWSLEVQSGQVDVERILRERKDTGTFLQERLRELSAGSIEEARGIAEKRAMLEREREKLCIKVETLLGQLSYAELEKQVSGMAEDKSVREPDVIREELKGAEIRLTELRRRIESLKLQIEEWEKEHTSYENVLEKLVELRSERREMEKELEALAPLPEEYKTPDQFLESLRAKGEKNKRLQEEIYKLKRDLSEIEREMPEESSEELQERLRLSEKGLARLKSRARAVLIIEEEFEKIVEEVDQKTFDPLVASFLRYFTPVTAYRYDRVHMEGAIPQKVAIADEKELPVDLLSIGTKRGLALALRLALAEYLWGEKGGFLIMDDPLVDLDPERRKNAARVLKNYSTLRQLLVTTCDPEVARLLGGKVIQI